MKSRGYTVKEKMLWLLLPIALSALIVLTLFASQLTRSLLMNEYEAQVDYISENVIHAMGLIDSGYQMLDQQLEVPMTEALIKFKTLYEAQSKPVDLERLKVILGNEYDLMVINSDTLVTHSTLPEGLGFNFSAFDAVLGEKLKEIMATEAVVHEKIRTNVGTGLLSKFSYVGVSDGTEMLELIYSEDQFSEIIKGLDPLKTLESLQNTSTIIKNINVYDVYGYQFTNSGELIKPSEALLGRIQRVIAEGQFDIANEHTFVRYLYLPEKEVNILSDHSRIIEINYDASEIQLVVQRITLIIFGVGALIILIALRLIYTVVKGITEPITLLSKAAQRVTEGDYSIAVEVGNQDEIGQLSSAFNTMMRQIQNAYGEIESKFETTLISMGDGVIATSAKGLITIINPVAAMLTGWTPDEAINRPIEEVLKIYHSQNEMDTRSSLYLINRKGQEIPIENTVSPIVSEGDASIGSVIVFRDVTDKRKQLERIEYLSYHDQLTGVYNRRYFEESLRRMDSETYLPLTMVMIDVNGLKLVNDAFGHQVGDYLLQTAAQLIYESCRSQDILSRIGGDEFVLLLPKTDFEAAETLMKRIYSRAMTADMKSIILSISYGVATRLNDTDSMSEVFKIAEDQMYRRKLSESTSMRYQMIELVLKTLYEKNEREKQHSERVSGLAERIGQTMSLNYEQCAELKTTGLMHDIGKIAIDLSLLDKPDQLTDAERLEIERHPEIGYQILKSINEFSNIAGFVLAHHECWDGSGYPRGLVGEEIPLQARIVAIADYYDAMTTDRPYRNAIPHSEVIGVIQSASGVVFDPGVVDAFMRCVNKNADA